MFKATRFFMPFFCLRNRKLISHVSKIALALFFCFWSHVSFAQNKSSLKAKIIDSVSQMPLNKATVAVINVQDSTLVAYTLSDQNGLFSLHNIPSAQQLRLIISYVSYSNFRKNFIINKGESLDLGIIQPHKKSIGLNEVIVHGDQVPVVIKKDTIEFSAEAFKVRPNAVVEELLNKLPGLQVNSDGTILVNGKGISKILVNGHEYFANDPRIASKNIDAAMIDKVQIYNDRENDPDSLLDESRVKKIINLKFKKKYKRSFFGKVYAGAGTNQRYETGLLLNSLRDTLQVTLIGYDNNLSRTAFSRDDLSALGGFNRSGMDQLSNGNITTGGRISDGIERVASAGMNINDDYGKKLKINFLFFLNHTNDTFKRSSLNQIFLHDTSLFQNQLNYKLLKQSSYNFSSLIQWNPSESDQIKYSPHLLLNSVNSGNEIFSDQYNNFGQHVNTESDTIQTRSYPNQFDQSLSYYKKLTIDGESLTITHKLGFNNIGVNNVLNNNLFNYVPNVANDTLHQLNKDVTNAFLLSTEVSFRYPFTKKLIGTINYNNTYTNNSAKVTTLAYNYLVVNYSTFLALQSSNIDRTNGTNTIRPSITYKFNDDVSLIAEFSNQWQTISNTVNNGVGYIKGRYFYFLPSISLQGGKYSLNYNEIITQPTISDLNPAIVKVNSYYSLVGNPFLTPFKTHNVSFNFYDYNPENEISILVFATATLTKNSIYYHSTFNSLGVQNLTPKNGGQSDYAFIGANITKKFKENNGWVISLKGNLYEGIRSTVVSINAVQGTLKLLLFNSFF